MRPLTAALFTTLVLSNGARPAGPPVSAPDAAIGRSLSFLAKDSLAWKKQHNCVSCHHAAMVIWALREAKERGHAVDEPALGELTKWVVASRDGSSLMRPPPASAPKVKVINLYAVLSALALESGGGPAADTRGAVATFLARVKADQTDEGPWQIWPEPGPRQPFFASAEVMSSLATLALLPDAAAKAARDKALMWLAARTPEDDAQADAIRLILWRRSGRPAGQTKLLVKRILGRQRGDGGWAQTKDMASDAFATGQALYALMESGLAPDDPVVRRARAFLTKTQRPDGSWPMTSRPSLPGDKGGTHVAITCAGTAWATLGLVRSSSGAAKGGHRVKSASTAGNR